MEKISFVIPCYCSAQTVGYVIEQIIETVEQSKKYDYEIILVNDGSKDNTYEVISEYACKNEHVIAVDLSRNFGQHSALMAAYSLVTGDYVLGMDDDGEHDASQMFRLIDKLEEGYDYVCAKFTTNDHSLYKRLGSRFNNWMATEFIGKPKDAIFSSYYVVRRYVIEEIVKSRNPHPYIGGMFVSVTKRLASVPIEHKTRRAGVSGYGLKKSVALWVNGVTAFSVAPLRFASIFGCGFACIGFVVGFIQVVRKLIYPEIAAGYTSLIACLFIIGGILMLQIGMVGEYIGRLYLLNNRIPQYVIRGICKKQCIETEGNVDE